MNCPTCGSQISDGSQFCPFCGTTLAGGAQPNGAGVPPKKKRSPVGLIIGVVAAVAVVVAAAGAAVALGLFSSPSVKVAKACAKSASAYAKAVNMGMPNLSQLSEKRSMSQRFSATINSIDSSLSYRDMSSLSGLGMRVNTDYDQEDREMDAEAVLLYDEEDLVSIRMLIDDNNVLFASPEFTKGSAYGVNTTTLGKDLFNLGADTDEFDLKKISFNIFDLIEKAAPTAEQQKEIRQAVLDAGKELFKAIEVTKTGKQSIQVNGKSTDAVCYHVMAPKDAMKDFVNALEDALKSVDSRSITKDVLQSMGFDKSTVNKLMDGMDDTDVYGELCDALKQLVKTIGDLELDVYVSGGYVCAAEYSDRIDGSRVEIGLYLGGGENYADDLSLEITADGEKLTVESTGNHTGKDGTYTDETTLKMGSDRITSVMSYEPKKSGNNFEWEMKVDNTAAVSMEGRLETTKDSIDLKLEDLAVKAAGSKLFSMEMEYCLGPCKGMQVSVSSAKMLSELDKDDLMDLMDEIQQNAEDWALDMMVKLPSDLVYALTR